MREEAHEQANTSPEAPENGDVLIPFHYYIFLNQT